MSHLEFLIAASIALFVSFLAGWLAGWLVLRAGRRIAAPATASPSTPSPADAAALSEARAELREAHIEIEELRAYIDRKLAQPPRRD